MLCLSRYHKLQFFKVVSAEKPGVRVGAYAA